MFTSEPLAVAERKVANKRRVFRDLDEFMGTEEWEHHELILGTGTIWDACHKQLLTDLSHAPWPVHSVARPYIDELVRLQGTDTRILDAELFSHQPPLYFSGPESGTYAYVDLVAAYWQLYRTATLDLSYDGTGPPRQGRCRFLGADELRPHKLLRNAIVGAIRATTRTEAWYGKVTTVRVGPEYLRPDLWAWIMDTLEAVAWEARMGFGAVHVNVDGYLVPEGAGDELVAYLGEVWGLEARIEARGEGAITGLGHWRVGEIEKGGAEEGFVDPHVAGAEHVDTMVRRDWTGLREWFVEAKEVLDTLPGVRVA